MSRCENKNGVSSPADPRRCNGNMESVPCPVCGGVNYHVYALVDTFRFCRCSGCSAIYQNPRLDELTVRAQYNSNYFSTGNVCSGYLNYSETQEQQRKTATWLWNQIYRLVGKPPRRVLDVGCGSGEFLIEGLSRDVECWGIDICAPQGNVPFRFMQGDFATVALPARHFDLIVFNDSFEHFLDPNLPLTRCEELLEPGGHIMVNTPDPDSWLAKISGRSWISLKHEHLVIYPPRVLARVLKQHHFLNLQRLASRQYVDWDYLRPRLARLSWVLSRIAALAARPLGKRHFLVPTGGMLMIARLD